MKNKQLRLRSKIALQLAGALALACNANAASQAVLLQGGDLYTVSDGIKPQTDLLMVDGKIAAIGAALTAPAGAEVIDVRGKRVYPGLVHGNTLAGLTEISAVRATNDFAEVGTSNANARAATAINPDSEILPVLRAQGVTTIHVMPQGQGISGTSVVLNTRGWTIENMALVSEAGLAVQWPSTRLPDFLPAAMREQIIGQANEAKLALGKTMRQAQEYALASKSASREQDLKLEALTPVLSGARKVYISASESSQVREGLAFCAEFSLRCVLVGAHEAWRYPDLLKRSKAELILGSPFDLPVRRSDSFDAMYTSAAKLHAQGFSFAISNDGSAFAAPMDGNLAHNAAHFAAYGVPEDVALAAITLMPAKILGVADRVGSLTVGKQADVFVSNGDALEISSRVEQVFIAGEKQDLVSRHTRLRDRYEGKLGQ